MSLTTLMAERVATVAEGRRLRGAPIPLWAEGKAVELALGWVDLAGERGVELLDLDLAGDVAGMALDSILGAWWRRTRRAS